MGDGGGGGGPGGVGAQDGMAGMGEFGGPGSGIGGNTGPGPDGGGPAAYQRNPNQYGMRKQNNQKNQGFKLDPSIVAGDIANSALWGGQSMMPPMNPMGYGQQNPMMGQSPMYGQGGPPFDLNRFLGGYK